MNRKPLRAARAGEPATAPTIGNARRLQVGRVLTAAPAVLLALGIGSASAQTSDAGRRLLLGIPPMIAAVATTGPEATGPEIVTYSYDAKGRLVRVARSGSVNNNVVADYTFDRADNRKNVKITGVP